jgi:demethylmenaquinone methyltransferase/2-methoxy-6-polyprenyl-1,4-benzoquinol methylase
MVDIVAQCRMFRADGVAADAAHDDNLTHNSRHYNEIQVMNKYTHNKERPKGKRIAEMFDGIAPRYDLLNRILSLGIDRAWRKRIVCRLVLQEATAVLDVATGTADLAVGITRHTGASVTGLDVSEMMLAKAASKIAKKGLSERISLTEGAAEAMPFEDNNFDAATVAFGARNYTHLEQGTSEMHRVLKKGGHIYVLEFSSPHKGLFAMLFRLYFHNVLPIIGGLVSGDRAAYRYLPRSVGEFPQREAFIAIMEQAGFKECSYIDMTSGIATLYEGVKE